MARKIDYIVNVKNGKGYLKKSAPVGWIKFIWAEGPIDGYTIEIYTKNQIVYKYENSPKIIVDNSINIPLAGEIEINIFGSDGAYKVAIGVEEEKIEDISKYLNKLL